MVALAGNEQHIETFPSFDQFINDDNGIGGVDVIIHIAMNQEQMALQVLRQLLVGRDLALERDISSLVGDLVHAMVLLAPPTVVDVVVMITCARDGHFEEIRIEQHGRCGHEPSSGMAVNADPVDIHVGIAGAQLLDRSLVIGQGIVSQVAIAVVVIPFRAAGVSASVTHANHDEAGLCQAVCTGIQGNVTEEGTLCLRTWIDVVDHRIDLGGVEVKRFEDDSVEIGHTVGGLHRERLWELVTVQLQL